MKPYPYLLGLAFAACASPAAQEHTETPDQPVVFTVVQDTNALGEGAFWYADQAQFWWIDIEGRALHTLDLSTQTHQHYEMPSRIGTVVPDTNGQAIVAVEGGIFRFDFDTETFTLIAHPQKGMDSIRYNDGKCDPQGRLWVGGMHLAERSGAAELYRIDPDGVATTWRDGITISNGLCWSADRKTMYYIDTPTGVVRAFGYNDATGEIDEGRVAITVPDSLGYPDGMVIDAEGMLWIGLWNGNSITRWDPATGDLLQQIAVPAHNVTACAFGGANLDTLYITTARKDMTAEELETYPLAGSVFGVVPGVKGTPMALFGQAQE